MLKRRYLHVYCAKSEKMDIINYNSIAWDKQVEKQNEWTQVVSKEQVAEAKKGQWQVVLTPHKAVPKSWFGDVAGKKVLCLASGGGQQGPILAALGAEVTVYDLSQKQLSQDRYVAQRDDLTIHTIQGDMTDLSIFKDESFDLIFHPCSNSFVPDIAPLWQEASRVLKQNGRLLSGFINPTAYIFDWFKAEKGEIAVRHKLPYSDINNLTETELNELKQQNEPFVFSHSLEDQIKGQLENGLVLVDMFEDNWDAMGFSAYFPPTMACLTIKLAHDVWIR